MDGYPRDWLGSISSLLFRFPSFWGGAASVVGLLAVLLVLLGIVPPERVAALFDALQADKIAEIAEAQARLRWIGATILLCYLFFRFHASRTEAIDITAAAASHPDAMNTAKALDLVRNFLGREDRPAYAGKSLAVLQTEIETLKTSIRPLLPQKDYSAFLAAGADGVRGTDRRVYSDDASFDYAVAIEEVLGMRRFLRALNNRLILADPS